MAAPLYSAADYVGALLALLPRGRVWPRESDATLVAVAAALAQSYARSNLRANQLLVDAFPANAYELLPEWEATLGLPDPILGIASTLQGRRAQVISRFIDDGGQSIAFLESFAAKLGYPIKVTNCCPFRMGQQRMGEPLGGPAWAHTFYVDAGPITVISFRMGLSAMGEPLESWGNGVLEAEIERVAPAHAIVIFRYPLADAADGPFILDSSRLG